MSPKANEDGLDLTPLLTRPERVAIVALGQSCMSFFQEVMTSSNMKKPFDEVWTVNRGLRGIPHDKLFVMDDLKWLEKRDEAYAKWLKKHDKPIITSTPYPDYPSSAPFPLQEVCENLKTDVFCANTVAYMVAYALYIGVKELTIYGADFVYPNGNTAEKGGQAVAFLLGIAHCREVNYRLPQTTTLLYANDVRQVGGQMKRIYYGYHRKDQMEAEKPKRKK